MLAVSGVPLSACRVCVNAPRRKLVVLIAPIDPHNRPSAPDVFLRPVKLPRSMKDDTVCACYNSKDYPSNTSICQIAVLSLCQMAVCFTSKDCPSNTCTSTCHIAVISRLAVGCTSKDCTPPIPRLQVGTYTYVLNICTEGVRELCSHDLNFFIVDVCTYFNYFDQLEMTPLLYCTRSNRRAY